MDPEDILKLYPQLPKRGWETELKQKNIFGLLSEACQNMEESEIVRLANHPYMTKSKLAFAIKCAATAGDYGVCKLLLDAYTKSNPNKKLLQQVMNIASFHGHLNIVELVFWYGASPAYRQSRALRFAAVKEQNHCADFLIRYGALPVYGQATGWELTKGSTPWLL